MLAFTIPVCAEKHITVLIMCVCVGGATLKSPNVKRYLNIHCGISSISQMRKLRPKYLPEVHRVRQSKVSQG